MNKKTDLEKFQKDNARSQPAPASAASPSSGFRTVDSKELFGSSVEIGILHEDSLYRLRITRGGKLILNK
ncbi:hemin uptake protein HemP [Terrihabitans sp. B22-R8]|uniref:hemin uptake protein HemP n=1 Tax=Terrihabitans sp. B22-R8 TaxID=3425128 RepID=UPI00403C942A